MRCAIRHSKCDSVVQIEAATRSVKAPTDAAIVSVSDVFPVEEDMLVLSELDAAPKVERYVAGDSTKERRLRDANAKNPILHLSERLTRCPKDVIGRAENTVWARTNEPTNGRSIVEEGGNAGPRTKSARASVFEIER